MKRFLILLLAFVLVAALATGGTMAWLAAKTDPVVNTFTPSDISITLTESQNLNLKMVPGTTLAKDPVVTVKGGSEACWLFVEVAESENLPQYITYAVAEGWTHGGTGGIPSDVWYRQVPAGETDQAFQILAYNQVSVLQTVTKQMMNAIAQGTTSAPQLTFTAWAVQQAGMTDAAAAWAARTGASS